MYFWESNFVFLRDCGTFSKKENLKKIIFDARVQN